MELPAFARHRSRYLDDAGFARLQATLMGAPIAGEVVAGSGGLRKLRFGDARRGKGRRGGLRVVYYWWEGGNQFWLFTLYDKDEASDLSAEQLEVLRSKIKAELAARRKR